MESSIYLGIIGLAAIILAAWAYTEQSVRKQLQHKLDQNELERAELIGDNNQLLMLNTKLEEDGKFLVKKVAELTNEKTVLKEKLDACQRVRDSKGRYAKK